VNTLVFIYLFKIVVIRRKPLEADPSA